MATEVEKCFVVRCRYVANAGQPAGVGYLDRDSRCTRDVRHAQTFATEDDAWTFAAVSGEQVPEDAWAEEHLKDDQLKRLRVHSPEEHGVLNYEDLPTSAAKDWDGTITSIRYETKFFFEEGRDSDAAKKLRENLDKARDAMEEKIKKESIEAMDRSLLGLADEDPEHFATLVRAGLGVTKEQVDAYGNSQPKLHRFGKPTPGDPFVAGMLQHVHDIPFTPMVGWDANGSPTEEWP